MAITFTTNIKGYWISLQNLPTHGGIYFVYGCTFNPKTNKVNIDKLIYIGETGQEGGIQSRISSHEKWDEWRLNLREGQQLCFSASEIISDKNNRLRIEAACIFQHKPPDNLNNIQNFNYPATTIKLKGKTAELNTLFHISGYAQEPPVIFFD